MPLPYQLPFRLESEGVSPGSFTERLIARMEPWNVSAGSARPVASGSSSVGTGGAGVQRTFVERLIERMGPWNR